MLSPEARFAMHVAAVLGLRLARVARQSGQTFPAQYVTDHVTGFTRWCVNERRRMRRGRRG